MLDNDLNMSSWKIISWIIRLLFFLKDVIIWVCPHGLFLKINKMSLLRKQLIADINNSLIENSKEDKLVANNTNIDKIFNYFDLSSKKIIIQVSNGYTYYIIKKEDLKEIKDQINNGIHDKKLLEFYKNDKKNICNKQHNNEYITIYKDTSILQMA